MPKTLRILILIVTAYILHAVILPRVLMMAIQPDVMLAVLVWLTADGDRYTGFCVGSIIGLILDAMVGVLPFVYLLAYPIMGYASARLTPVLFDRLPRPKPKKAGKFLSMKRFFQLIPSITAAAMALLYEFALMVYRYLNGVDVTLDTVGRIFRYALYTAIAAFFAQFYVRYVMTHKRARKGEKEPAQAG